ncbi:hypothetical protein ACIGO9_14740 [Nocardia asteroides]|uniref:hypothetical protein n=1 Tax=Nocardia asteroides TaxID=1824 RepID=UPI0037C61DA3
MTTKLEVLPNGVGQYDRHAEALRWGLPAGRGSAVAGNLDWDLGSLGEVPVAAADLVRLAAAAYLADRHAPRPTTFTRTIELTVHLSDPTAWNGELGEHLQSLLAWLTGDSWILRGVPGPSWVAMPSDLSTRADDVMLLSGGLDSLCGAAAHLGDEAQRIHLSHIDGNNAVRKAQNAIIAWLKPKSPKTFRHQRIEFRQPGGAEESSSRSRSLLFMALATAVAAASGCRQVTVPENGFTSINPPLTAARGGALSTRSTHPDTFARINHLIDRLALPVTIANPYGYYTKGELLDHAHAHVGPQLLTVAAASLSCSKLDGQYYAGGNSNYNCGLCFACIVRRAAFTRGDHSDLSPYLATSLTGEALQKLHDRRHRDIRDIQQALIEGIDDTAVLAVGSLPADCDIDAIIDVCHRSLEEIGRVPLP